MVTYSARGFGRSCGKPDSRTVPGCDARLAPPRRPALRGPRHAAPARPARGPGRGAPGRARRDRRLLRRHPDLSLARLRNRIRLPDGSFQPWTSPTGTPLRIAAAYPRWAASDLTYALQPNGRFLDFRTSKLGPEHQARRGAEEELQRRPLPRSATRPASTRPRAAPFSAGHHDLEGAHRPGRARPRRRAARSAGSSPRFHSWAGLTGVRRAAARAERLDRRPLPGPRGAARVPDLHAARRRARLAPARRPRPPARPNKRPSTARCNDAGRAFLAAYLKGRGQAAGARQRHRVHADLPRTTRRPAARSRRELGAPAPGR